MPTVAVTGASGRLGQRIVAELCKIKAPDTIVALTRTPKTLSGPLSTDHVRAADYANPAQMTEAFANVHTAVLISAPVKTGVDRIILHRNAISAAKAAGVSRLLYTSVIGNGKEAGTWYDETQEVNRVTEQDLKDSGLEVTICRNGLYLDLDLLHLRAAADQGHYQNNAGEGRCGYIAIDELAFATARLATHPQSTPTTINLIGETVSQQELVACANRVFEMNVSYQPISEQANVERLMAHPMVAKRGIEVAQMLTGCFQCMAKGAFDVEPQFHLAAGRPAKPLEQQMREIGSRMGWLPDD
ncbi:MAG: NAD(P)H-binding protein [Lysobacterales bacterium]